MFAVFNGILLAFVGRSASILSLWTLLRPIPALTKNYFPPRIKIKVFPFDGLKVILGAAAATDCSEADNLI